jgi:hypothetical protein
MAKLGTVQNGLKKSNGLKRKSNPLTLARVKGFAKKNGFSIMAKGLPKLAANPKRRKHRRTHKRRNGLTPVLTTRRNGLFGNTKADAKNVGALLGGLLGGKAVGRVISGVAAPYASSMGLGNYTEIASDLIVAIFLAPFVAGKVGGANAASMARLGGLANVAVDLIELFAPNTLSMFGANPILSASGQVGLSPAAVTAIVNSTNAPIADKAKVAGAMAALESGNIPVTYSSSPRVSMLND